MLICPHCELDMTDEAEKIYFQTNAGPHFEMGCPWCNRAVTVDLDRDGEFRADKIRPRIA